MRYVIAVLGLILVIAGLAGVKTAQISSLMKMGEAMAKAGPPAEIVGTAIAGEQMWDGRVAAVGSVATAMGVTVSNDAPGVVSAIKFTSGAVVKRGQVLVELDSRVERAQLSSALARRDLARVSAGRSRALVEKDVTPQSELDNADASMKSAAADVAALQAQIDRKIVRAPFDGRIGIRQVNLGQYLNPGTAVATLQALEAVFIDFTLPQQELGGVTTGSSVTVDAQGTVVQGTIEAIEPTVDSATRSLKVRASVKEQLDKLRPGMFVEISVVVGTAKRTVTVPATAVVHAPYGDSIFIVEQGKARQQFVRTGETRGDFVAVLEGVKPGQEVVVAGAFKLRNGAGVTVNNSVKLDPKLDPRPQNR